MSIAGLKFHSGSTGDRIGNPLETKSGSYIYWGDPASFHDWKFRTELRIKLYDQAQTQPAKKQDPVTGPADEGEPWPPESDEGFAFPSPGHYPEEFEPEPRETAGTPKSKVDATSPKASSVKSDKSSIIDRSVLVNKIVEGLRGDAFLLARDLGLETLARPGGLERLIEVIRNHVFPRALEESKELFRAGQKHGGPLSRQPTESMLSYTQRRRRWWTLLVELDPTMMISEAFRTELLLEMSGMSRQEILVVKACRKNDDFEGTARVLVDNYSGIHLREGSRSWTGRGIQPQVGKGKGYQKGYQGKGKGSQYPRAGYNAIYPDWEDNFEWRDEDLQEHHHEEDSFVGMLGGVEESEEHEHASHPEYEDFEYHDDVDEYEAIALNAVVDCDDAEERSSGDAIQLQLAAFVAFGKAKGKGKDKFKGKGKGKGKIVKSHLSIEQRRQKLSEIKAKSKCLRCGGLGHWAGDPQCKMPNAPKTGSAPKPAAHIAHMSDSSEDEGIFLGAASPTDSVAHMAVKASSGVRPEAPVSPNDLVRPEGSDRKFLAGQFRGKTFWQILHEHPDYHQWAIKNGKSPIASAFVTWVDQHFEYRGASVFRKVGGASSSSSLQPIPKGSSRKKPPYPPREKCKNCSEFTKQGSTAYTIKKTCLVCGNSTTERREQAPKFAYDDCPHSDTDFRGSSRSVHRVYCKLCCSFLDETPMELQKTRKAASEKVVNAPLDRIPMIERLVEEEPEEGHTPEMLEKILTEFAAQVALAAETEAVTSIKLHELLHQSIEESKGDSFTMVDYTEDPDPFAGIGICFHGEEPARMTDGLVHIFHESRDMYNPDDKNIYIVLDEGCNSTCHSKHWGDVVEAKLKKLGYDFPFSTTTSKNFAGLGENGTTTEGSRTLPFSLHFETGKPVHGVLESHQLSKGRSPLLLSLHAQTHLGLVKDLKNGIVSIDGNHLKVYRCVHTGLMMLAVTPQQLIQNFQQTSELQVIPKCHRRFRTAYPAMERGWNGERGFQANSATEVSKALDTMVSSLQPREFLIITGGERFPDRINFRSNSYPILELNAKDFHDPEQNVSLRGHVGRHPEIVQGLLRGKRSLDTILRKVDRFCDEEDRGVIDLKCKSGRHRSVGGSIIIYRHLKAKGISCKIIHQHSPEWAQMSCGGRCSLCGPGHPEAVSTPIVLTPNQTSSIRSIPVATTTSSDKGAPWRHPPKAMPPTLEPKQKSGPKSTAAPKSSAASAPASARPVPEFDDESEDEDIRVVESVEEDVKPEEEGEEEMPTDDPPAGSSNENREILHALRQLTDVVSTLAGRGTRSRSPLRRKRTSDVPDPRPRSKRGRSRSRSPPSTRPKSAAAPKKPESPSTSPVILSPHTPDHPPPPGPPPRLLNKTRYDESQRVDLEDELWPLLTDDGEPKVDQVDPELLHALAGAAADWGNRDRTLWLVNRNLPAKDQQWFGVRVDIKVRAGVYNTATTKAGWMRKWGWLKTVYARRREAGATWERIQNGAPVQALASIQDPWSDVICFTHRSPQVYMALQQSVVLAPAPKIDVRSSVPPTPPKPRRLRESPKTSGSEDTRTPEGSIISQTVRPESEPQSPTSPVSTESASYEPVAHMAWDLDRREQVEINLEDSNETDSEVPPDPNAQPSSSGVLSIPLQIDPNERTTMGKKHRRAVLEGIDRLNHQDALVKSSIGLKDVPVSEPPTLVITSHPRIFQELQAADGVADVFDVGVGAEYLNPGEDSKIWYDVLQDYKNIVIAIEYEQSTDPLRHGKILGEVESHCDMSGSRFLHIDVATTPRWEEHEFPQIPHINDHDLAFTCNDPKWTELFESWFRGQTMNDVLSWQFVDWLGEWTNDTTLDDEMSIAFVGELQEEVMDDEQQFDAIWDDDDRAQVNPVEDLISEETLVDEVDIPGLPADEAERRRMWRKLPARVRIGVRRLHRQFGHVPKQTMIHLLRAAKVRKEFIDAVRIHRRETCEATSQKKATHKTALPNNYSFNHTVGIDVFEVHDISGDKFQVLNMVCLGTTFQLCEVVRFGAGQPSSAECLKALRKRWFSWCGHPVNIACDRGLHNRGVMKKYMDEHGIQVYHTPLESPENLGRVERHGGIVKSLFRKVCKETSAVGREQVEQVLLEVVATKNNSSRVGGFSPSQWVLGKGPRSDPSPLSEERFAELGAIEARHNPESIFALQHMARQEAQKAFVHLDCSSRVSRALTRNASSLPREYAVGDLVTFRRDNQKGGTTWSPTSRVIGHEGERNLWLLCGNVPVLVANQNVKIATPTEALAHAVLHGEPVFPENVVKEGVQQSFLDARADPSEPGSPIHIESQETEPQFPDAGSLPPVPEDDELDVGIRPDFFDEDQSEGEDALEELSRSASSVSRPFPDTGNEHSRNVRPRVAEPESERGTSLQPSRRESTSAPHAWPNVYDHLNDLPASLREHFERARQRDGELPEQDREEAHAMWTSFLAQTEDEAELGKKVLKSIHYESAPPEVQKALQETRQKEWSKFEDFGAVVALTPEQAQELIDEGHQCIPSKWVDVDKAEYKKGRDPDYKPMYKSRLVSCGNFEMTEGLRSDSPTADVEMHCLVCSWAACHQADIHSADITSAYFQGRPLDRVLLMRQPRGGLPGVEPNVLFLVRVPVYGITDSGRGFWLRLDADARKSGLKASQFFPGLYYLPGEQGGDACALMCTHVDDLLYSFLPEGEEVMKSFLAKFSVGSSDTNSFRYCGKQFVRGDDKVIKVDTADNTRKIHGADVGSRLGSERLQQGDITKLRSITGSLAWISRQTRPDLGYRVSRLQSSIKDATVSTLADANAVVVLAHKGHDVALCFPAAHLQWSEVGVITVTDASFSNEKNYKSQQGRIHFLGDLKEIKDDKTTTYKVMPLSFGSTTIKRVCRSTLQAETYSLQNGLETGDKLRGVIAEIKGKIRSLKTWEDDARECIPHLAMTDCRSLSDHLNQEVLAKVSDKRLGIELQGIHENLWQEGRPTWIAFENGGDKLIWIATSTMVSDCLTKSMKPDLLLRVLKECHYTVQKQK